MNERTIAKCRTCLKKSTKTFPLTKPMRGCTPKTTYEQILREYAQIEYNADYERHMPQYLCFLCCRQLRNTYIFICQVRNCNQKLTSVIAKQIDCLREQTIDLPRLQEQTSISIKKENLNNVTEKEDQDTRDSITAEDDRSMEGNLEANITLIGEHITEKVEHAKHDIEENLNKDNNNFNIETNINTTVPTSTEASTILNKCDISQTEDSLLDEVQCPICNKLIARHDNLKNHLCIQPDVTEIASSTFAQRLSPPPKKEHILFEKCPSKCSNKYKYLNQVKNKHGRKEATNTMNNNNIEKSKNKIIKCQSCDYTAKSYAALNYHNRSKHGNESDKLKCKFCSYTSFKKCNLLVHVKNVHKELIKTLKANAKSQTNESIISDNNLNNNNSTSSDFLRMPPKEKENSVDNIEYSSEDDIPLAHTMTKLSSAYTSEVEQEKEEFSDEDFIRNILNIKKRPRKILSTKSLARRCEECGNIYKNYKSLCAHQRSVHISEDKFSLCPHCGKKYKRKSDLRIHIAKNHAAPSKCTETVKKPAIPKTREKRFMCTECSYVCTTITILNIHRNRHHTGEKPHKCDICYKSFIVPYDLKVHRYLHTGEKPYKCPVCCKGFRHNSHMLKHKRIHTNERPYKCNDCGKSFTQSYNLSVHKRTHLKEKKLNCSVCGKFFENKSILNIHRINKNHHDEVL